MLRKRFVFCLLTILCAACPAFAQGWGHLKGRFVYDGEAPKPDPLSITKDQAYCGKHNLVDESLVVNSKNQGLANAVLYIYLGLGGEAPPIHPDYAENKTVVLDNQKCRFAPHVCAVRTTDTLRLANTDPIPHNSKVNTFSNVAINPLIPPGGHLDKQFPARELLPVKVECSIHPWMSGYVVIKDHPYVAISDENGKFEIKNIPAGDWTFRAWQEKSGYLQEVTVDGQPTTWRLGRFKQTIEDGETVDLGEILVNPANFQKG